MVYDYYDYVANYVVLVAEELKELNIKNGKGEGIEEILLRCNTAFYGDTPFIDREDVLKGIEIAKKKGAICWDQRQSKENENIGRVAPWRFYLNKKRD